MEEDNITPADKFANLQINAAALGVALMCMEDFASKLARQALASGAISDDQLLMIAHSAIADGKDTSGVGQSIQDEAKSITQGIAFLEALLKSVIA